MPSSFWSVLLAGLATAHMALAHESDLEERMRAYILDNPEVIFEALEILAQRQEQAALVERLAAFPEVFTAPPALGIGADDAAIRVVEFFDYRCAPCKALHPGLEDLVRRQPDLRLEMRHLPILSPGSERAARFALATQQVAGRQAYQRVHAALWTLKGPLNEVRFKEIADAAGLDFEQIKAGMRSAPVTAEINRNRDLAIALGILGTPAFVTPTSVQFGETDIETLSRLWLNQ